MQLTTTRLILRELTPSDLDVLYYIFNDPEMVIYEPRRTLEETQTRLEKFINQAAEDPRTHYRFAVTLPEDGRMVGLVGLNLNWAEIEEWEIGWRTVKDEWGKGYATEAARELMRFAFESLNAHRVLAICHADNAASCRVMEKLGMIREGRLRQTRRLNGQWFDEYVYGILREEYLP